MRCCWWCCCLARRELARNSTEDPVLTLIGRCKPGGQQCSGKGEREGERVLVLVLVLLVLLGWKVRAAGRRKERDVVEMDGETACRFSN